MPKVVASACQWQPHDRFTAAICRPLHYGMAMPQRLCRLLVAVSYAAGAASGAIHTSMAFRLPFCGARTLDDFFCDIPPVLALACANTDLNELLLLAVCGAIQSITLAAIMASYGMILCTVGQAGQDYFIKEKKDVEQRKKQSFLNPFLTGRSHP
uniref:Uncharacterized protein n=1 Tax=Sphaerodactylus townsendi TaxID=933632 RepID=A0ACB8EMY5_9SAUR